MPTLPLGKNLKNKEKERKGAGAPLPPLAGAGRIPLGANTIRTAATVGASPLPSSQLGIFLQLLGRATGLETILSSKTGLALFVLAGSSLAVLLSLWVGSNYASSGRPTRVFPGSESASSSPSAQSPAAASAPSSLDYLAAANRSPAKEEAPAQAAVQAQEPPQAKALKASIPPKPQGAVQPAQIPTLKAAKPGSAAGNSLSSRINLAAMKDVANGIGTKFQDIYKRPTDPFASSRSQRPPRYGANHKTAVVGGRGNAFQQAKLTALFSQRGAAMASANGAASTASMPFDANNTAGRINALGETGGGFKSSANPSLGNASVSPPPAPNQPQQTQNQTPYQNLIFAGIAALLIGTMLVMVAGQLVNAAQSNPEAAPQLLAAAKALAAAAAAAGGTAIALGVIIGQKFQQITQGLPYIIGGAVVIAKAAEVMIKAMQAGQEAADGVNSAASSSASDALSSLSNIGSALNNNLNNNQNNQQQNNNQNQQPHGAGISRNDLGGENPTGSWYTGQ